MKQKFDALTDPTMNLMYADYVHEIERIIEHDDHVPLFMYGVDRNMMVNELKRMEAWIIEHRKRSAQPKKGAGDE